MEHGDLIGRVYLIRKGGFYYRPKCSGYTSSAITAGRYTLEEAERYTHPNGPDGPRDDMTFIHEDDVPDPEWRLVASLNARIAALEAELAAAREAALEEAAKVAEGWDCDGSDFPLDYHDSRADDAGPFIATAIRALKAAQP